MMKKAAVAALKYAGKKGAKNARKKVSKGLERIARAVKPNPARKGRERARGTDPDDVRENPGYDHAGASFDLFGGESRRLPKKVSEFHRPRVRVRGSTLTLAEGSPFKGRVARVNPAPRIVYRPLRVFLDAKERAQLEGGRYPSAELVAEILARAQKIGGWDHIEAFGPGGRHLFDVVP